MARWLEAQKMATRGAQQHVELLEFRISKWQILRAGGREEGGGGGGAGAKGLEGLA